MGKARDLFKKIGHTKGIFNVVDHSKLWKILQETGIPDHLTCPL